MSQTGNWFFKVVVKEGFEGHLDTDEYTSVKFDYFDDCLEEFNNFNPSEFWRYLRFVKSKLIYFVDGMNEIPVELTKENIIIMTKTNMPIK